MSNQRFGYADTLCRACLKVLAADILDTSKHDIFLTPDLKKKFVVCTSLVVEPQDEFPRFLCDNCYQKLSEFHNFHGMCIDSVQRFKEMLQLHLANSLASDDEKSEFEFNAETKIEITIGESAVLYESENVANKQRALANALAGKKRRGRPAKIKNAKAISDDDDEDDDLPLNKLAAVADKRSHRRNEKHLDIKTDAKMLEQMECIKNEDAKSVVSSDDGGFEEVAVESKDDSDMDFTYTNQQKLKPNKEISHNTRNKRTHRKSIGKTLRATVAASDANSANRLNAYQCNICPTRFFVEHRLIAHKRRHDGLVPYPCPRDGCEKAFNRWHCLSEHLKQHEGSNRWYTCEEAGCGKVYKHKPTLVMHLRKFHKRGPELKSHICEICGKVFKASSILNDHRYTHKDKSELPYACDQPNCQRRFSKKEKLKVHLMRHAGIKNFVCPYCNMRKTTRNELKIHINYHTLERTWPCRFCTHVCNSAGNLKMHVRTVHERAKDYECRYCQRTFAKPDTKKYHEMTHTGEKPNECKECGKRFTQPAALRTHRKIHQRQHMQPTTLTTPTDAQTLISVDVTPQSVMQSHNNNCTTSPLIVAENSLITQFCADDGVNNESNLQNLLPATNSNI